MTKVMSAPVQQWILVLLTTIIIAVVSGALAHATVTFASKDSVAANQREIKFVRTDIRDFRQNFNERFDKLLRERRK